MADNRTVSHELRFLVYGSGPRLIEEYIAITPLFVMALVCIFDLALLFIYKVAPAPWLEPAGLLCLANMSDRLSFVGDGDYQGAADRAHIFAKSVGDELRIVDRRPDDLELVDRRKGYRYR